MLFSSTLWSLMASFFYVNQPVVDIRENPSDQSKVESQVILSEEILIETQDRDWSYIQCSDSSKGWIHSNSFISREKPYIPTHFVTRLRAHVYREKDIDYGPIKTLPYGTKLLVLNEEDSRWLKVAFPDESVAFIQQGDVAKELRLKSKGDLVEWSYRFLDLPYTWGGRSSFGYDCSGFAQMLYHQIGIDLQRNSRQQILDPRLKSIPIDALEPGDLIFFGKSSERIMHVGLYLGDEKFIHSTARENRPWIRISNLTDAEWSGQSSAYYPFRTARQLTK